jgi:hypothetical protein
MRSDIDLYASKGVDIGRNESIFPKDPRRCLRMYIAETTAVGPDSGGTVEMSQYLVQYLRVGMNLKRRDRRFQHRAYISKCHGVAKNTSEPGEAGDKARISWSMQGNFTNLQYTSETTERSHSLATSSTLNWNMCVLTYSSCPTI